MASSNSGRRPIVEGGVLRWVAPEHPSVGRPFVPFSGRGRSLTEPSAPSHRTRRDSVDSHHDDAAPPTSVHPPGFVPFSGVGHRLTEPSTPLHGGPLSQQNIDYLRRHAEDAHHPRYLGLRHTTNESDRTHAAANGSVARPGFQGDAYGMVPELNRAMRARFPQFNFPNPGFSGTDAAFNSAMGAGIRNSVDWDMGRLPGHATTVGDAAHHISGNTEFAIANMGGQPRQDAHDRYGASTQKFGRRTVSPDNVLSEMRATPEHLGHAARQRSLSLSSPLSSHAPAASDAFSHAYGQHINHALDHAREAEHTTALRHETPADRRARIAAAADLRMLQAQVRGRPNLQRQHQASMTALQQTVRRPPR